MTRPNDFDATSSATRKATRLAPKLDKSLLAYAAAASAAGVGLLAAQSAEAKIVYTAANMTIPVNGGLVSFDLNNDGIPDFGFYNTSYFGSARKLPLGLYRHSLTIDPANPANEVWTVQSQGVGCAAALPAKVKVGPGAPFQPNNAVMWEAAGDYTNQFSAKCPWLQDHHRGAFLGLKFVVNGQTHYGWAHVGFANGSTVLNGYAYETVPNQPIFTGKTSGPVIADSGVAPLSAQPATLGLLAQGARGLAMWRRPEEGVANS